MTNIALGFGPGLVAAQISVDSNAAVGEFCDTIKVYGNAKHMISDKSDEKKMASVKLLIIDDEVEFASTLCKRLILRGIDAKDVHSGTEGLARLAEIAPEIVIVDLKMPDMNGLDVLSAIKKHDPAIEVIMLTGHGSGGSGVEAMKKGAFEYIMKPIDLSELLTKIKSADEKRRKV